MLLAPLAASRHISQEPGSGRARMKIWIVDAFTDRVFTGNPAAVVPMDRWLPDATLQAIAAENRLSETAFVVPTGLRGNYQLRWFTPKVEVPRIIRALLDRRGIVMVPLDAARTRFLVGGAPTLAELRVRHAELRGLVLGSLTRTIRLAAASLHLALPPRRYALPRLPSVAAPALASRGARCHPPSSGTPASSGRRPRPR